MECARLRRVILECMRPDLVPLVPDVILEANQHLRGMEAELNTLAEGRQSDRRALEVAIRELRQVIQRHLQ
jgi:hypothetical protein